MVKRSVGDVPESEKEISSGHHFRINSMFCSVFCLVETLNFMFFP